MLVLYNVRVLFLALCVCVCVCVSVSALIVLFQKAKEEEWVEDMEFPGLLKKEHMEIPHVKLKKKWNF